MQLMNYSTTLALCGWIVRCVWAIRTYQLTLSFEHLATGPYVVLVNPVKGHSSKFNVIKIR